MNSHIEIVETLKENTDRLFEFLKDIDRELLIEKPAPDKWSIMENLDHIFQVEKGINFVFTGATELEERDPQAKFDQIEKDFMDFDRRFTAMGPILPKGQFEDLDSIKKSISKNRKMLTEIGNSRGWDETCLAFEHRLFGAMTRMEWIWFTIVHTNRHLVQMENCK